MKNKRNLCIKTLSRLLCILAITCSMSLSAQAPQGPPTGQTDTADNDTDSIPLDAGLSILLVGAAAFGIKKLRDNKA
jgi:hypothetical protein